MHAREDLRLNSGFGKCYEWATFVVQNSGSGERVAAERSRMLGVARDCRAVAAGFATGFATGLAAASNGRASERPNIVFIMADDMGFSDIGCYGPEIRTPHLDALAEKGVRFRQFYNTARCCPTRASLMTRLYPHLAGTGWQTAGTSDRPGYRGELRADVPTIAETLGGSGYGAYMSGKWHLTFAPSVEAGPNGSWPVQRGFTEHFGTIYGGGSFWKPRGLVRGLERLDRDEETWREGDPDGSF